MKMLEHWQIYALGSAFFAGAVSILAKIGIANIPSNLVTLIRAAIITFLLVLLVSVRREWVNPSVLDTRSLIFIVLSAVATGLSWICYFRALQMAPASTVAPLDKLSLAFSVFLAVLFLREHLSGLQWGGVILMTLGALLVGLK